VVLQGAELEKGQGKITGMWDGESNEGSVVEMIESFTADEVMWGMLEGDKSSCVNGEEMIGKWRVSGNGLVKTHVVLSDALMRRWGKEWNGKVDSWKVTSLDIKMVLDWRSSNL